MQDIKIFGQTEKDMYRVTKSDAGFIFSYDIAQRFGTNSAVLAGALYTLYLTHYNKTINTKDYNDGWFKASRNLIYQLTGLSSFQQKEAQKWLIHDDLIETKKKGIPAVTHYRLLPHLFQCMQTMIYLYKEEKEDN